MMETRLLSRCVRVSSKHFKLIEPKNRHDRSIDRHKCLVRLLVLSPITNMERLCFRETLGGDMPRDIPSPIQPIEILDQSLISKAERVQKMRVSCEMNQERVRYGRSRETVMKMSVSNDAARLSQRSWRFFPAFRSKSFERDDMQCDLR